MIGVSRRDVLIMEIDQGAVATTQRLPNRVIVNFAATLALAAAKLEFIGDVDRAA